MHDNNIIIIAKIVTGVPLNSCGIQYWAGVVGLVLDWGQNSTSY